MTTPEDDARVREASEFLDDNDLVGLSTDEAVRRVRAAGFPFRDVDADRQIFSGDLRPGRITVLVRDGVVVEAEAGC